MQQVLCDGGEVEMNDRGVYWRRNLSREGFPVCYAVDSRGNTIRSYKVTHPSFADNAVTILWDVLDRADPTPDARRAQLTLVLPTTEHRSYLEAFDVYNMPPLQRPTRA
jgi:hypothetical protein